MEKRNLALSLLFLAVIFSGCIDNSEGKASGKAMVINGPNVQPTEIFEGASVRVDVSVENSGKIDGKIKIGENGREIITDYCPDFFSIERFNAHSSRESGTSPSYELQPGEQVQMNWELEQQGGKVPLNGYSCPMKFQVPFDYSVQAYHQIQIKQEDTTSGDVQLSSKSSQGPMTILIETIGSSSSRGSPVFLKEDQPEALIQLVNEEPEQSSYRGVVRLQDLEVEASGVNIEPLEECRGYEEGEPIELLHGKSQVIRCDITNPSKALGSNPSIRAEISASADYTYIRSLGSKTVEVKYSGN